MLIVALAAPHIELQSPICSCLCFWQALFIQAENVLFQEFTLSWSCSLPQKYQVKHFSFTWKSNWRDLPMLMKFWNYFIGKTQWFQFGAGICCSVVGLQRCCWFWFQWQLTLPGHMTSHWEKIGICNAHETSVAIPQCLQPYQTICKGTASDSPCIAPAEPLRQETLSCNACIQAGDHLLGLQRAENMCMKRRLCESMCYKEEME